MQRFISILTAVLPLAATAPTRLVARQGDGGACQAKSMGDFAWTMEKFTLVTTTNSTKSSPQSVTSKLEFDLVNPALSYKATCTAASASLSDAFDGNVAFTCTETGADPGAEAMGQTTVTTFNFAHSTSQLHINQSWFCSTDDPMWPVHMSGFGEAALDMDCADSNWVNPNWAPGQVYSSHQTTCDLTNDTMKPYQMEAVA